MAVLLYPLHETLFPRMRNHTAALISTIALLLLVILPTLSLTTVAVRDAARLVQSLSQQAQTTDYTSIVQTWADHFSRYLPFLDNTDIQDHMTRSFELLINWLSAVILGFARDIPSLLLQLVLGTLSCYFFLVDGRRMKDWFFSLLKNDKDSFVEVFDAFQEATRTTLYASLAAAVIQSTIVMLTFITLNIPQATLAAGMTFIFAWIPVLGSAPVFFAGGLWLYTEGEQWKIVAVVIAAVITGLADNVIRPVILQGSRGMHPLVSLVAILGGIEAFGLLGVVFGPVIVAMFLASADVWRRENSKTIASL